MAANQRLGVTVMKSRSGSWIRGQVVGLFVLRAMLGLTLLATGACSKQENLVGPEPQPVTHTQVPNPDLRADGVGWILDGSIDLDPGWPSRRIPLGAARTARAARADTDTVLVTQGSWVKPLLDYSFRGDFVNAKTRFYVNGTDIGLVDLPWAPPKTEFQTGVASGPSFRIPDTSTYTFRATLDATDQYSEVDEANNSAVLVVRGVPGDLWVDEIRAGILPSGRADTVAVGQSVLLEGTCSSSALLTNVRIVLDVDGTAVVDTLVGFSPDFHFWGFDSKAVSGNWVAVSPGIHTVTLRVDPDNLHPERFETNNQIQKRILVTPIP
jgi:hypothetical protein